MRQSVRYSIVVFFAIGSVLPDAMASVSGTVVTGDLTPVAGARISAYRPESQEERGRRLLSDHPEASPAATTTTDANGRFTIDVKAPVVQVLVQSGAGAAAQVDAEADDDLGIILLPIDPSRTMVATAGGKPIANATVVTGSLVTQSDAQGRYVLPSTSSPGEAFIIHPDYSILRVSTGLVGGKGARATEMVPGVALEGIVQNDAGDIAVKGAVVWIDGFPLATTGEEGKFSIRHAPGRWSTAFVTDGTSSAVVWRKSTGLYVVRLHRAVSLSGKVVDKGKGTPVAGATVRFMGGPVIRTAISDANGAFAFKAVPPASYWLEAVHPAYRGGSNSTVRIEGAKDVTRVVEVIAASRVAGTVVDEQHKPIAGALVWSGYVMSPPGVGGTSIGLTAADGTFTLRNAGWGPQSSVAASKRGYVPSRVRNVTTTEGQTTRGVTVTLPRGFEAAIDVDDSEGAAVDGAAVAMTRWMDETGGQKDMLVCAAADRSQCFATARGSLKLQVQPGKYDITISGPDLVSKQLRGAIVSTRTTPLKITVVRGAVVSGRVLFHDETPAAGVSVGVRGVDGSQSTGDGSFELRGIPPGAATIVAHAVTGSSEEKRITAPASGVVLHVGRPGRVEGRVIDKQTRQPIAEFRAWTSGGGAPIGVRLSEDGPAPQQHSEDGSFALEDVRPGLVEVRAMAAGYMIGRRSGLVVEEGRTSSGVEIELTRGVRLSGRITGSDHTPLPKVYVSIVRTEDTSRDAGSSAVADDAGEFVFDGLAPGEKTLTFATSGYLRTRKTIDLADVDPHVQVEMDRGREVQGRVVDDSGNPIPAASVSASSGSASSGSNGTTDVAGSFKLESMAPGNYSVIATKQGYVPSRLTGVEGATAQNLTLVLKRGGTVTGRCTGMTESDAEHAYVSLRGAEGAFLGSAVDASGNFIVSGVPDGTFTISASAGSGPVRQTSPKSVTVVSGTSSPVELEFRLGASLQGRITRSGKALERATVNACCIGMVSGNAVTGADGTYEIRDLLPGSYQVMVNADGSSTRGVSVTVNASGATYDLDLTDATIRGRVIDTNGQPVADATISLSRGAGTRQLSSDSDGRFLAEHVADGNYRLGAQRSHYGSVAKDVSVDNGSAVDVELILAPVEATVIRVVDARDDSVLDASVLVSDSSHGQIQTSAASRTDDGAMRLWLEPGDYALLVSANGYARQELKVTIPGTPIQVRLGRAGSLNITYSGVATVRAEVESSSGDHSGMVRLFTGRMRSIDGLTAGTYLLRVVDDFGKTIRTYPVQVVEGRATSVSVE